MRSDKYRMSFTSGGLFHTESAKLISLFFHLKEWSDVRDKVVTDNLLQTKTVSASKRLSREIVLRLQHLSMKELDYFIEAQPKDQCYILWISVCRCYNFIGDFSIEVLRERYLALKMDLPHNEFDIFFNKKAEWHSEIDKIKLSTKQKLRQVLFRMLREADLLEGNGIIKPAILSPRFLEIIQHKNQQDILYFPILE